MTQNGPKPRGLFKSKFSKNDVNDGEESEEVIWQTEIKISSQHQS